MRIAAYLAVVIAFGAVLGVYLVDGPKPDLALDSRPPLEVTILPLSGEVVNCFDSLGVRIKNRSHRPITILHPLDGSEECWLMPYYRLTLLDDQGNTIPRNTYRCGVYGLWANMNWPNDYRITLQPGQSFDHRVQLSYHVPKDGKYRAVFEYVYEPSQKPGLPPFAAVGYPSELWIGSARSPECSIQVKARPE